MGVIPTANTHSRRMEPKREHFYEKSWTCPTLKDFALQWLGLAISNAVAIHIPNAKKCALVRVDDEDLLSDDTDPDETHEDRWFHSPSLDHRCHHRTASPPSLPVQDLDAIHPAQR